ncbi:MAG: transposase, partial [Pseudanabaena sp.]
MDRKFLDLYTDYLISSFGKVTATGLSELLEGELSHDQITNRLRQCTGKSAELWHLVKPTIRKYESEDGVLIFDDTLEPKPCSAENTIIGWYFDHSHNHSIKGINILNCIYNNQHISLPVAFEIVQKLQEVTEPKTGNVKFVSEETKNEMMRKMLYVCCQNRLQFSYVLTDSWFSSKENMQYIKQRVTKDFIMALKSNRLALCADTKSQ